jgi:hypothetical protein
LSNLLIGTADPRLRLNYRYGNFYNCPIKETGISVKSEAFSVKSGFGFHLLA